MVKYIKKYNFAFIDLYFYDGLSTERVFYSIGIQFSGFTLVRTFSNNTRFTDTAFITHFKLDTVSFDDIIYNFNFRFKFKDLKHYYLKSEMKSVQKNSINMDIEITFCTT